MSHTVRKSIVELDNERTHSLSTYHTDNTIERQKFKGVLYYVIFASILWLIIGGTIFYVNIHKQLILSQTKYTQFCCDCWYIAQNNSYYDSYNGPKLDWSYCINDCSCNKCQNASIMNDNPLLPSHNYTSIDETCNDMDINEPETDYNPYISSCFDYLSTSSLAWFSKSYNIYGMIGLITSIIEILFLWLNVLIYKSINIGMIFFIYNLLSSGICYYSLFKCYQYYEYKYIEYDNIICFRNIVTDQDDSSIETSFVSAIMYLLLGDIIIGWIFSLLRGFFKKCLNGRKLCRLWSTFICFYTICSIIFCLLVFCVISIQILKSIHNYKTDEIILLIIVMISLFLVCFGILLFPFCCEVRRNMYQAWNCCNCFKYLCCHKAKDNDENEYYKLAERHYSVSYSVSEL